MAFRCDDDIASYDDVIIAHDIASEYDVTSDEDIASDDDVISAHGITSEYDVMSSLVTMTSSRPTKTPFHLKVDFCWSAMSKTEPDDDDTWPVNHPVRLTLQGPTL